MWNVQILLVMGSVVAESRPASCVCANDNKDKEMSASSAVRNLG